MWEINCKKRLADMQFRANSVGMHLEEDIPTGRRCPELLLWKKDPYIGKITLLKTTDWGVLDRYLRHEELMRGRP